MMMEAEAFRKVDPSQFHYAFLSNNVRHDGRTFAAFRKPFFSKSVISNCNGSASLRCGKTFVIAGVKAEISENFFEPMDEFQNTQISDRLEKFSEPSATNIKKFSNKSKKIIYPTVEFPRTHAFEIKDNFGWTNNIEESLSNSLSELLNSTDVIDQENLRIAPNSTSSWIFHLRVNFLEYDGNFNDTSLLVSLAALENSKLPLIYWDAKAQWWRQQNTTSNRSITSTTFSKSNFINNQDVPKSIKFLNRPLSITFTNLFDSYWIADPCKEEEEIGLSISLQQIGQNWSLKKGNGNEFDIKGVEPTLRHISSIISNELKISLDQLKAL